jgi:flagellar hook-associated protein 2
MPLTAAGIGSGLDINSLISQLMALEQRPVLALDRKEASYQARLSAFGTLKGTLATLQSAAKALTSPEKFSAYQASIADPTLLAASASSGASAGSYSVEVQSLARAQKLKSDGFADSGAVIGEGTLTIEFGRYAASGLDTVFTANSGKPAQAIQIPASGNTLAGIRDAINAAGIDMSATIVNDGSASRLVLTSSDTGLDNALRITAADDDGNHTDHAGLSRLVFDATVTGGVPGAQNLSEAVSAKDALVVLDGIAITRSSNTISDAADGLTLTLLKEAPGTTTTLAVARDPALVSNAAQALVKAYNDAVKSFRDLSGYDAASKSGGILLGDSTVRSIQSRLRTILFGSVDTGVAGISSFSDVGISFQTDGTLAFDAAKFDAAMSTSSTALSSLFTGATTGIASRLDTTIGAWLATDGLIASRTEGIDGTIRDIGRRREALELRLIQVERRYRAQFTALDAMVASMTQTSAFLEQQLANLPTPSQGENN